MAAGDFVISTVLLIDARDVTLLLPEADLFFVSGALLGRDARTVETADLFVVNSLPPAPTAVGDALGLAGPDDALIELLGDAETGLDIDDLEDVAFVVDVLADDV